MNYISSRGGGAPASSTTAIMRGIAEDGGLYVPETLPRLPDPESLLSYSYTDLAYEILRLFLTDFPEEDLKDAVYRAYDDTFSVPEVAPIEKVGERFFLELYHGPTAAFKDVALSILPRLITGSMKARGSDSEVLILTATSGDTGKAALSGFADVDGTKILVFYPKDGVSAIQKLQMQTQEGDNIAVFGVDGNFDDCQSGVKTLFADEELTHSLAKDGIVLSSANSINIGRLLPQIVYYVSSYLELRRREEITPGEKVNFVVPTGNFGNILAGWLAKSMGLPVGRLICASNENNVLTEFLRTGRYDKRRELKLTNSPSMDILISSNLERYLYFLSDGDDGLVSRLMEELQREGFYELPSNLKEKIDLYADFAYEIEGEENIRLTYEQEGYLMDTHTAVADTVYRKYVADTKDETKTVILSTASPFKFAHSVMRAMGCKHSSDALETVDKLSRIFHLPIPANIDALHHKPVLHPRSLKREEMRDALIQFASGGTR